MVIFANCVTSSCAFKLCVLKDRTPPENKLSLESSRRLWLKLESLFRQEELPDL